MICMSKFWSRKCKNT